MSIQISKLAEQKQVDGLDFPLLITPPNAEVSTSEEASLKWIKENKADLHKLLIKHGALLLRGFPVSNSDAFERMLDNTDYENMPYIGGAAPRSQVTASRIVTAN
ncbi:MAG: hypothetical protein RL143_1138 [Pseudomonadota bacterium]